MKVILLEDVKSLGKKGEIVTVSDAYARNVIFAKKLGLEATGKNLNDLKLQNKHADKVAQEQLEAAKALAKELEDKVVEVKMKAGEGGRIFVVILIFVISKISFFGPDKGHGVDSEGIIFITYRKIIL